MRNQGRLSPVSLTAGLLATITGLFRRGLPQQPKEEGPVSREKFEKARYRNAYGDKVSGTLGRRANNHFGAAFIPPSKPMKMSGLGSKHDTRSQLNDESDRREAQSRRDLVAYERSVKTLGMRRAAQRRVA